MVTAVVGAGAVPSAPGRAKSLLACLAWQPGQLVPDELLIERIWDDRLPADPQDALYTCAKRLRRSLAAGGGRADRLARHRGGYLLDAPPRSVDIHRFRSLVRQAQLARDRAAAAFLYERALKITHGVPLADVESAWADRIRQALEQERLSAELAAAGAWLDCGHHRELVPELARLAAHHPLNEEVARLLMRALHRSGQPAAALAQYRRIRDELAEELGVDPGPGLRAAYEELLALGQQRCAPALGR
nr:AfsR/SARP family transcriptional regulator [Streptomyces sp. SID9124]